MSDLQKARQVATTCLRACYQTDGIIAGPHHFTDYWARDGYFAALGALELGDTDIVDRQLALFFSHQRSTGEIPYRVMRGPISLGKYLGHPTFYTKPRPTYRLRGFGPHVLDGTTLTILFAALRGQAQYLPQINQALQYLAAREKNGLLFDYPMGEWNDCTWKWGNLLYSNIIYWHMYARLAAWKKDPHYAAKRDEIARDLRARLWNGHFFADWHDYKRQDYLYPFGNCLAIVWGLTTPAESASILEAVAGTRINFSVDTNTPAYPWWRTDLTNHLLGINDYQNHGTLWWQTATSYLAALKVAGKEVAHHAYRQEIIEKILADQMIYEVYERDGRPLKRLQYTAEHPFAWASGMILWALAV